MTLTLTGINSEFQFFSNVQEILFWKCPAIVSALRRPIYVIMSPDHMCVGLLYAQASLALIIVTKGKIKKNSHGIRPTYKGPTS